MEIRAPLLLSVLLIAGMLGVSAWAWSALGETAPIATHFDFAGQPNGFMPRDRALLFVPTVATVMALLFAVMPRLTSRKEGLAASSSGYVTGWVGTMMLLFVAHCAVVLKARGWQVDVPGSMSIAVALVLIAAGNVLGKTRPNAFVGVRTPWTRQSDYSWDKSNRAAGRMMVVTGLATLATLAAAGSSTASVVMLTGLTVMAITSVALSYYYWRRDPARRSGRD
jgi:uncharacterized membrane protein